MKLLEGKTALVTGASKGIGRAIAMEFASQGAQVAFTYLSSVEQGEALVDELKALGAAQAKGYRSDASKFEDAEKLINQVIEEFGALDILVNNAGITRDNLLMRMSEEHWDQVIQTNLKVSIQHGKSLHQEFYEAKRWLNHKHNLGCRY